MHDDIVDQARLLHKTVKALQARTMLRKVMCEAQSGQPSRDLTLPQLTTLLGVRDGGEMSLKEIARATGVSAPSASTMVERLVEYGLLNREHSRVDRREVRVSISKAGKHIVEQVEQQLLQSLIELLEKMGPDYAEKWCEVYSKLSEILDDEERERLSADGVYAEGVK